MTQAAVGTVEERLAALEQVEAIKALKHRYFRACDTKDPESLRSCFIAVGADIAYGPLGDFADADHLAAVFARIALHTVDGQPVILDMHHGLHPDITLTGSGRAVGRWTLKFRQLNLIERTERLLSGEYDDDYVLQGGAWKMARSHFRQLWSITRPLGPDAVVER